MADQFTTVATIGYGKRIMNSFAGVIVGLVLFIGAFFLLYWNEGRIDTSQIAKTAVPVDASTMRTDTSLREKLVSVTGTVSIAETLGDGLYLKPASYVAFERKAEMYAWTEQEKSTSQKNVGGSETTTTTYTYEKQWTERPQDSANFKTTAGHENPIMTATSAEGRSKTIKVGAYPMGTDGLPLRGFTPLDLNDANVSLAGGAKLSGRSFVFLGKGTPETPEIGDIRVSYETIAPGGTATAFAKFDGSGLVPFFDKNGNSLYDLVAGERDQATATLHTEYANTAWALRGLGWLMMWIGLILLFAPISVILDVLPIFGGIGRFAFGAASLVISIALSAVVIIVSRLFHNPLAAFIAAIIALVAACLVLFRKKKNAPAA